jgi:hypothetical protein
MSTRCNIEFYYAPEGPGEMGEPAARLYKHSDGYPDGILPLLKKLETLLGKNLPNYGPRKDNPEWAAAEFINQFRTPSNAPKNPAEKFGPYFGNIYVSQQIHGDIEFLYRVICHEKKWEVLIFTPVYTAHEITAFEPYVEKPKPRRQRIKLDSNVA